MRRSKIGKAADKIKDVPEVDDLSHLPSRVVFCQITKFSGIDRFNNPKNKRSMNDPSGSQDWREVEFTEAQAGGRPKIIGLDELSEVEEIPHKLLYPTQCEEIEKEVNCETPSCGKKRARKRATFSRRPKKQKKHQ